MSWIKIGLNLVTVQTNYFAPQPDLDLTPLSYGGDVLPDFWGIPGFSNIPQEYGRASVLNATEVACDPNGGTAGPGYFNTIDACWRANYYEWAVYDFYVAEVITDSEFDAREESLEGPIQIWTGTDYLGFSRSYAEPTYRWFYIYEPLGPKAVDDNINITLFEFGEVIGNVLGNDTYDGPGALRVVEREFSQSGYTFSVSENGDVVIVSADEGAQLPEKVTFQYTVVAPDGLEDVGQVSILAPPCDDIDRFAKLTNSLLENIEKLELSKNVIANNKIQIEQLGSATAGLGITLSWSAGAYAAARWAELTVDYLTSVAGAFNPVYGALFTAATTVRDLSRGDIGKVNVDGIKLTAETMVDGVVSNDARFKDIPGNIGTGLGLLYDTLKLPYEFQTVQEEAAQARNDIQSTAVYLDELQQEIDASIVASQALIQTISQQEQLLKEIDCRHNPAAEFLRDISSAMESSFLPSVALPVNPLQNTFYDIYTSADFRAIAEAGGKNPDILIDLGSDQNDLFEATNAAEVFVSSQGNDNVSGTAKQLDGDQITGFRSGDKITLIGLNLDSSAFKLTGGSTIIDIDVDDDQVSDTTITLLGDAPGILFISRENGNTIISADGNGEVVSIVDVSDDDEDDPLPGVLIEGTSGSDTLVGTDTADAIRSLAGSYDKMQGGAEADQFLFGAEANNGIRERDVILDYEVGLDEIVLQGGASVASIRETSSQVVVFLEGDRDAIYVRGDGVTDNNITIVTESEFDLV